MDLAEDTRQLGRYLDALHSPTVSSAQFHRCVELFFGRALRLSGEYRKHLRGIMMPLPGPLLAETRALTLALKRVAAGFEKVLLDARQGAIRNRRKLSETATARALRLMIEQYLISAMSGVEPEPDLWRTAYRLYSLVREESEDADTLGDSGESALFAFKRLLALASLEPQSLSPAELDWAAEYVLRTGNQLHIQGLPPPALDGSWYWIDLQGGTEPTPCIRRLPPEGRAVLFFSTMVLSRRATELLIRNEGGRTSPELASSELFPDVQPATLLARLQLRWASPPRREQPRRRQEYEVEACLGLPAIWRVLRHGTQTEDAEVSTWKVVNESPGGYSIMNIVGSLGGLLAGMAVALRRHAEDPWTISLVRWLRRDENDQMEIGLQVVSKGAIPVQVGFRGADRQNIMTEALVLPVLPALRQHQAVLTHSGTYASRRFALVSDIDRLYVAQCRLLSLDVQTSKIELFQFEVDPYPI